MRCLLLVLLAAFSSCGPDVAAWKGTWRGSGSINAGRGPEAVTGTLTVTDDARFALQSDVMGAVWNASLVATKVEAATVTFALPASTTLNVTPADSCTHALTINTVTADRQADALTLTVAGRIANMCTMGSSSTNDFLLSLAGTRSSP